MSNYCMNPRSQGMHRPAPEKYNSTCPTCPANSQTDANCTHDVHWHDMPIAMAYVPKQKYGHIFDLSKGLEVGTIFPELCKPFCGKGGGC